jgi:2-hydroxy-3-oxopropionate reductase
MSETVGVIGLGLMGWPMARNLLAAGFDVVVHNRSQSRTDQFLAEHPSARGASTPAEVAGQATIIITMLPASADVEMVVLGEDGILEAAQSGHLVIDMSTIAPATSVMVHAALADKGASSLDAPVSGGDRGAIAGTLSIMVGGSSEDLERAMPVFEALGSTITHCGGPGAGQTVKSCNQIVVGIAYQAVSEALVLGSKAGVDPQKIIQVLDGGLASTAVLRLRGDAMCRGDFEPGGRASLHLKDLGIALDNAKALNVPLPVASIIREKYLEVEARGLGDRDHSVLLKLLEDAANHSISGQA